MLFKKDELEELTERNLARAVCVDRAQQRVHVALVDAAEDFQVLQPPPQLGLFGGRRDKSSRYKSSRCTVRRDRAVEMEPPLSVSHLRKAASSGTPCVFSATHKT